VGSVGALLAHHIHKEVGEQTAVERHLEDLDAVPSEYTIVGWEEALGDDALGDDRGY
jgi:hypothetical protein